MTRRGTGPRSGCGPAARGGGRRAARPVAQAAGGAGCRIEGALQIREAAERKAQLCAALDAGVETIDLSAVTTVDTAGVQLLVALAGEAASRRRALRLCGCPPALRAAVRSLGVDSLLEPLMAEAARAQPDPV